VTDSVMIEDDNVPAMRISPERLAWGVLLLAFAVFCAICVISTLGAYHFLFQSSVPLDVELVVGRGTVGIVEADGTRLAEDDRRSLDRNVGVRTSEQDRWSQSTITINDSRHNEAHIATVVLRSNSSVVFNGASRPRFEWASSDYDISFDDLSGTVDLFVADDLDRELTLLFDGISGERVRVMGSGRYVIESTEDSIIVTNREGNIFLVSADGLNAFGVPQGERVVLNADSSNIERLPNYVNLIQNSTLRVGGEPFAIAGNIPAVAWECTSGPTENLPIGNFSQSTLPNDRTAYHLLRGNNADTNGFTRCIQDFGDGIDVTAYDYLALQVVFSVAYQSLNGCGTEATECPMMVSIKYKISPDPDADTIEWLHGVYTQSLAPAQNNWKLQCATCYQPHIEINDNVWYIYDSGNLFDAIPQDRQPAVLVQVEFFSEGHQYDVYFDEVSLFARPRAVNVGMSRADKR
jgi:hypothetical protein